MKSKIRKYSRRKRKKMRERKKEPARASKTRNRKGHLLFWKW